MVCRSCALPPPVVYFVLGLKKMSASSTCPTNVALVPCFVLSPGASAVVVKVTASVLDSWLNSPEQTKQMRFCPSKPCALLVVSGPRDMERAALGAVVHVSNEACITSATERVPLMFEPRSVLTTQTTGKAAKSQRSSCAVPPPRVYMGR